MSSRLSTKIFLFASLVSADEMLGMNVTRLKFVPKSVVAVLLLLVGTTPGAELSFRAQLSHTNLLVYATKRGLVAPVETWAEWKRRRAEIVQSMQDITGPLPGRQKRCPLDVKIEAEVDAG